MNKKIWLVCIISIIIFGVVIAFVLVKQHRAHQQTAIRKVAIRKFSSAAPAGPPDPAWANNDLCMAVYNDNLGKLKELLDAHPEELNQGFGAAHSTLLHLAARYGTPDIAEELLQRGADINARTLQGHTPLFDAVDRSHIMMVTALLNHGADMSIPDEKGRTPLQLAITGGHTGSTALLRQHGATK